MLPRVLSIHDKSASGVLSFDIKDVMKCFGSALGDYWWLVIHLECFSADVAPVRLGDDARGAGGAGVPIAATELLRISELIRQTVEAKILAFPGGTSRDALTSLDTNLAHFPQSRAEHAVLAIDSAYFEVYTKSLHVADAVKSLFKDVREENPQQYFFEV